MRQVDKDAVNEAIRLVSMAQDLVDNAVQGTSKEAHYEAYGRYGFDTLLGNGNRYDAGLRDLLVDEEDDDEG